MSVTIGSACTPHSCTTTARSPIRKRAERRMSRHVAEATSPTNATALTLPAPRSSAVVPRRAIHGVWTEVRRTPGFSGTASASARSR